uniref:Uncharacterized protein n=1 Tax=Amphiprion ocellaris TaxID=80972 RepID=A0A3Q1C680_AMPOC
MSVPQVSSRILQNQKRSSGELSDTVTPDSNCILGVCIQHNWREGEIRANGKEQHLTDSVNPSLFMVKYDGYDCVCGIEFFMDESIKAANLVEELVGKAVEHLGMVLSRAPIMTNWYYITYEKDPVLYMYQLWDDYADGDLRILLEAGIANFVSNKLRFIQYKTEDRTPLCNTIEILNEFKLYKLKIFVVLLSLTVGYLLLCRIKTNNLDLLYHNY